MSLHKTPFSQMT